MKTTTSSYMLALFVFASTMLFFSSCKSYYIASDFKERTRDDKVIAILPFEMIYMGKIPDNLSDEDIEMMNIADSKSFMISFYDEVLASTIRGRKAMRVNVQHYDKTLRILEDNGIDLKTSWGEEPDKLAALLGVDAVVKGRIKKHRFMSDLASYGISTGIRVFTVATGKDPWNWVPMDVVNSKEIQTSYSLVDQDGTALWSIGYDYGGDYRQSAEEIVESINERSVKHFPYRKKT